MGHVTLPRPFQEQFVIHRLGLDMVNLHTKFEVSTLTHYLFTTIWKATQNVEFGVVWVLVVTQSDRQYHSELIVKSRLILTYRTCIWRPRRK